MCNPTVTSAVSSAARIAEARRASHARAAARVGGTTQLEFSLPRSHAQTASCPARAAAASAASRTWASPTAGSVYQLRSPVSTTAAARDDPEASVSVRASERPRRDPVHAAHVTGEKRGDQREPEPAGEIGDHDEPIEHRAIDPARGRLEVFPGEEHPHRVETAGGDPRKVGCNLGRIESRPPAHRGTRRPVVDADPERLPRGLGLSGRPRVRVAVELDDTLVEGEVVVHHPLDVEAPFDRRAHGCPVEGARAASTAATASSTRIDEEAVLAVVGRSRPSSRVAGR